MQIIETDEALLLYLNGMHCPAIDSVMWFVSGKLSWLPLYILLTYFMWRRLGWRQTVVSLLFIAAMIALCDRACSHLIRPLFERLRPSNLQNPISSLVHIVNGYRGGAYGFPSCHAANTFALAVFQMLLFRNRWAVLLLAWAVVVCYSRVYIGVHYPGDIAVGMLIGSAFGTAFYYLSLLPYRSLALVTVASVRKVLARQTG